MITEFDLKNALLSLIQSQYKFPQYHFYSVESAEQKEKPYFVTNMQLLEQTDETLNVILKKYFVTITYEPQQRDEMDHFEKIETFRQLLYQKNDNMKKSNMGIQVKEKHIKVDKFAYTYVGNEKNQLQIQLNLSFFESSVIQQTEPKIKSIQMEG